MDSNRHVLSSNVYLGCSNAFGLCCIAASLHCSAYIPIHRAVSFLGILTCDPIGSSLTSHAVSHNPTGAYPTLGGRLDICQLDFVRPSRGTVLFAMQSIPTYRLSFFFWPCLTFLLSALVISNFIASSLFSSLSSYSASKHDQHLLPSVLTRILCHHRVALHIKSVIKYQVG